ncbi:MAG: transposase [Candidatus Absconditabacterales bacterium]|nr:transposase [Candidatus Absconditabacterales bacterium]
MVNAAKYREIQSNFVLNVPGENLNHNNPVFLVDRIIHGFLSENSFLLPNKETNRGRRKTYQTGELLGFIVWGVLNGITSCRGLENWLNNNDETCNYILNNKKPSKSTIARFFNSNMFLIEELFRYTVNLGIKYDLIGFEHVAIDGTILKANVNKFRVIKMCEREYLENLITEMEKDDDLLFKLEKYFLDDVLDENNHIIIQEIKNESKKEVLNLLTKSLMSDEEKREVLDFIVYLKANYNGKNTISLTDPESRWMKDKKGNTGLNYNYQVATDDKYDFIVAQKLVNDPTDHHQFIPMSDEVKMNLNRHPTLYTADNGYLTDKTAEYCYQNNITTIMPDRTESIKIKHQKPENRFKKHNFQYNWEEDVYICPQNQILKYTNNRRINSKLYRVYSTKQCKNCIHSQECYKGIKREIFHTANPLKIKMSENYNSDLGRKTYRKRFHTGETYFAILKNSRKFPGIQRKTIKKAQTELTLQTIAHNIKIIHKHLKPH